MSERRVMGSTQRASEDHRLNSINKKLSRMTNEVTGKLLEGINHENKAHDKFEKRIARLEGIVQLIGGKLEEALKEKSQKTEEICLNLAGSFDKEKKQMMKRMKEIDQTCQAVAAQTDQFQRQFEGQIKLNKKIHREKNWTI